MSIRCNVPNLFQMQGSRSATSTLAATLELLSLEERGWPINPKKASDWRRLARSADFAMTSHCKRLCEQLYPGRTRAACLQGEACKCELWCKAYAAGRDLWEALALVGDDAEPTLGLQKNLLQYHCLVLVLCKQGGGNLTWLEDKSHGSDDGDREATREEQAEDKEEDVSFSRFKLLLCCAGFPR